MKYLETYNERSGLRLGTTRYTYDDLERLISIHCKNFSWDDKPILRSVEINKEVKGFKDNGIYVIDPKLKKRKSRSNKNWYTLMIDNSEKWKDYPKRSESLICSLETPLWNENLYRVIPYDNSKWGVCTKGDIWYSLPYGTEKYDMDFSDLINFLDILNRKFYPVYGETGLIIKATTDISDDKYTTFIKRLKQIGIKLKKIKEEPTKKNIKQLWEYLKQGGDIIDYFEDMIDPDKNGFKLLNYKNLLEEKRTNVGIGKEIWTDSTCILVPKMFLDINTYKLSNKKITLYQ